MKRVLAFDFGASGGRAVLGSFDGERITLNEIHRFANEPVKVGDTFYWDVLRLFHEVKQGLLKARLAGGFDSVGIDTWGVDFALVDSRGKMLENPVHYRDGRNSGMARLSERYISRERLYELTGIQFMDFNTVFQLLSLKLNRPELLERADRLLFMPDLFAYFLTGKITAEYSIATTSQLVDIHSRTWSEEIVEALGLPRRIFPPIAETGTVLGGLSPEICSELGLPGADVISVAGHDTQSAVTAVPCADGDFAFISSGTWSLFGTETEKPIVSPESLSLNMTNEGGYAYSTAFLKNICGLWLIQESRRQWMREGKEYSYAELEKQALSAEAFKCFIDPDAPDFVPMGDMPERVRGFCRSRGQYVPETVGEVVRCIYESLALKYRCVFEGLQRCTGKKYGCIHVVGGGTKDSLLCKMTACSCGVEVKAGPVEATVLGNIAVQLIASGAVGSISEARRIIADGESLKLFSPENTAAWNKAYEEFKRYMTA